MFHHSLDEGKGGRKRVEGGTHTLINTHTQNSLQGRKGREHKGSLVRERHTHTK